MKKMAWVFFVLFAAEWAGAVERLPLELFASLPEMQDVQLSPDGTRIATVINRGSDSLVVARGVESSDLNLLAKADNRDIFINWFRWANNERILVSLRLTESRYGIDTIESRLVSIKWDGSNMINLIKFNPNNTRITHISQYQDRVVDWLTDRQHRVRVGVKFVNGDFEVIYTDPEVREWRTAWKYAALCAID